MTNSIDHNSGVTAVHSGQPAVKAKSGSVLVVGGGVAGMQAALDAADAGFKVFLLERRAYIGGNMISLDKTFPTNDCAMCMISPRLVETARHLNIEIISYADLKEISGGPGDFRVTVEKRPRFVDESRCTGCGVCMSKCPVQIPDQYNQGLNKTKCIHIAFPQAVPAVPIISKEHCIYFRHGKCRICEKVCEANAVDYNMKSELRQLHVGALIVAGGYEVFDATRKSVYGFGRYANVVTSMQFERVLSASGPWQGHLQRPSDGSTPQKIAWIQCVGSRDVTIGNDYCSSVCCMYATKEAMLAKEHEETVEPTIFHIDIRAFGKGFERFYNRAKDERGVRYVRSQVSSLRENPQNQNVIVRYVSEEKGGRIVEEEFGMVVLSVGMTAHPATADFSALMGIECDRFGFARSNVFETSRSSKEGIFLCGTTGGPKDIPETVVQSSAAAALCGEILRPMRGTEAQTKEYPAEKDVAEQESRIGVFVCHCGTNIASVVDVKAVVEYVKVLPNVVYAEDTLFACSQDTQKRIREIIREKGLNRVVVASCSPRTHEPLFQETIRDAGLNKYLFEMADIREQCSWVHYDAPQSATEKAKALVRGSLAKSRLLQPLVLSKVGVCKGALVIGGGAAGMSAALSLAKQGFPAYLIEKTGRLGGNLHDLRWSIAGYDWHEYLRHITEQVQSNDDIRVFMNCEIDQVTGFVGNFVTKLKGVCQEEIRHGVVLVASGARELQPTDFLYGVDKRVVTQRELEKMLDELEQETSSSERRIPNCVVMIQCVGSRIKERPYCSRVCCGQAVKNALRIKRNSSGTDVYVLYRDMRTYEFKEEYYRKAREAGVMFIRFPDDRYPAVTADGGKLSLKVYDALLSEEIGLTPELLVLGTAVVPDVENNERLSESLKIPLTEDSFFMEAHVKLRPVDCANEGIFVFGLAHSPKYTEENISQAVAAAGRAACILSKDFLEISGAVSAVDPERCASCLTCVRECVYDAPFINAEGKADIESVKCHGCGVCAAACPAGAIQLLTFTDKQERALVWNILKEEPAFAGGDTAE